MGVLLHNSPIEDGYGCMHDSCYASIRGNFSVVRKDGLGGGWYLVANLTVHVSKEARDAKKEQLESVQVAVALPSSFPAEDPIVEDPFGLLYGEIVKQFPNCEAC